MNDRTLVAALVGGDPRGLERAYRAYADSLYTYCQGLVSDPDTAVDAVHDGFVLASQRVARLRDPARLRSWLYAITRNECLRRTRGRPWHPPQAGVEQPEPPEHPEPPPPADPPEQAEPPEPVDSAEPVDPEERPDPVAQADTAELDQVTSLPQPEIEELVRAAAAILSPGEWEAFELAVRHELPARDIEAVLAVSSTEVHARLSRARARLEQGLRTLMLVRTGARACPRLTGLLAGWDGQLTAHVHKRVAGHVESCGTCADRQQRQLRPATLISGYASTPYLTVPDLLWPRLELNAFDPGFAPEREAIVRRAGSFDPRTGFPRPLDERRRQRLAVAGVTAVAIALLAAATGAIIPTREDNQPDPPPAAASTSPTVPASAAASVSPTAAPTPTRSTTPNPPPSQSRTPDPEQPPRPATPGRNVLPAETLTVQASAQVGCVLGGLLGYSLAVTADASRGLDSAELFVATDSQTRSFEMTVDGSGASGESELMSAAEFTWWVEVTSTGDQDAATEPAEVSEPCG